MKKKGIKYLKSMNTIVMINIDNKYCKRI